MLFLFFILFQLFYSIQCQLTCHNCPRESNIFNTIITADTIPENLKDCTLISEQMECSIHVTWTQNPDQTILILMPGGERNSISNRYNLQNTITLTNTGSQLQWTKSLDFICSTEQCNSPIILKRLLKSLKSDDSFYTLSQLLEINNQFHGSLCNFFANSSMSCETEMDQNTCKQCATQEYIESKPVEVCSNCVMDDIIENFITRQVKFFMNNRERHDMWMIECQQRDCNAIETGDLIRQKSDIQFDFDLFLNNGNNKFKDISSVCLLFSIFMKTFYL
ncbi:unnamed protein product [Adineta steineri]|uniref:Uncharacterized protein n=1 Tax=Adineta steineri TaxID=433720 RepID=A0A813UV92_9BILA|nr:unnamed protein product [Adineta steineri]CAF0990179.1 unnamed protein product [Adineta steineri]CAF3598146.1 unnamed protein product [Adineta steineri]CAF4138533.1 unnamed protein product [Adineta steineri]